MANKKIVSSNTNAKFEEFIELIETAIDQVGELADTIDQAARLADKLPMDYNMGGNIKAYVLNRLVNSPDCVEEKLNTYLEQVEDAQSEGIDFDDEDFDDEDLEEFDENA